MGADKGKLVSGGKDKSRKREEAMGAFQDGKEEIMEQRKMRLHPILASLLLVNDQ